MRVMRLGIAVLALTALIAPVLPAGAEPPRPRITAAATEAKVTDPVPLFELRTADNGWFWTLSNSEAAAADSQYGMTPVRSKLGYLRRQPFTGSQPIFRMRVKARSAYLLTPSTSERDTLVASGNYLYEGTIGHLFATQATGTAALWRMSNGIEWRVVPDAQRADFAARGYRTDGRLGYVPMTYNRAGAIYFANWDAKGNQSLLNNAERVYGRRDWWAGLRDFAGVGVEKRPWHWANEDWSDLEPSIGYYDDSQTATLEKQIKQAAGAGLDHFAFYWYWNPANGGNENYVEGLKSFLRAANRSQLDFTIMPCIHPWKDGPVGLQLPADQIDRAAQVIVDSYLSQPNFLRANDGRKVLTVCDTRGIGAGTAAGSDVPSVRRFNDAIRAKARAKFGEEILITHNADLGIDTSAAGFEGRQCQGQWSPTRSYQKYVDNQRAFFASRPGVLMRCITSNFDERPRIGIQIPDPNPPTQANLEKAFRWYPDHTIDRFRALIATVQADMDASTRPALVDNFVLVYAWNEWHEGGYVEPNKRDGCLYLNAVRTGFKLTNGVGCVANPA